MMVAPSSSIEKRLHELQLRRRQPTYWIDRVLRAVLGFPAYLISLLFGFDRYSLLGGRARALAFNSRYQSLREETARAKEIAKGLREIAKAKEDFDAAERRLGTM